MEQIVFPELLLKFNTPYVAFNFFNIKVTWQVIICFAGFIASMFLLSKSKENYYVRFKDILEILPLTILSGFFGARVLYVAFRLTPYLEDPIKFFEFSDGGFEILGGMLCGFAMAMHLCKVYDLTKKDVLDFFIPFFALMQFFASIGVMYNIKIFGDYTGDAMLRIRYTLNGTTEESYALFAYEFLLTLAIFIITRLKQKKRFFQGEIFALYLLIYGFGKFYIEGLRRNPMIFSGFNFGQIICFLFIIEGIILLGIGFIKKLNNPQRHIME